MTARTRLGAVTLLAGGALFATAAVAGEDAWRDYSFADKGFLVQFPHDPDRRETHYEAATPAGVTVPVPATEFAITSGHSRFAATVAELAGSGADDPKALDHAVDRVRREGDVGLETWISISNGACGKFLGLTGRDGALNFVGLYYNAPHRRLYEIRAVVPPGEQAEHGADASHFEQSLSFLADPDAKPAPAPVWPTGWQAVTYDDPGFSIRFPGQPRVEQTSYTTEQHIIVPATRYEAAAGGVQLRVTVAKLWETDADTPDAPDQAAHLWSHGRTLASLDVVGLANAQCGREVSQRESDGSVARARIFFPSSQHRLYIVESRGPAPAPGGPDVAGLFQQSFAVAKPADQ